MVSLAKICAPARPHRPRGGPKAGHPFGFTWQGGPYMTQRIGFIGMGAMGAPMVRRLLSHDYPLILHDIRAEIVAELCDLGHGGVSDAEKGVFPIMPAAKA